MYLPSFQAYQPVHDVASSPAPSQLFSLGEPGHEAIHDVLSPTHRPWLLPEDTVSGKETGNQAIEKYRESRRQNKP